jgi:hypothetical protein
MAKSKHVEPGHEITIAGSRFVIPSPYKAGHVCTEVEAHASNQTLLEKVRNNLGTPMPEDQA